MRTEAEISHLWQFAHLKFYFGEKLAVHSMQAGDSPAMEFAARRGENEFRLNASIRILNSQAGSTLC
jgi:predicted deacetylase